MRLRRPRLSLGLLSCCLILEAVALKKVTCFSCLDPSSNDLSEPTDIDAGADPARVRRSAKAFRSLGNQKQGLIPANYNVFEPPPTLNGGPSKVNVSIIIMSVRGVNEKDEEIILEMNLRMFWQDERLSHLAKGTDNDSFVVLNPNLLHEIWHPDIFIDHAISVAQPSLITPPASLRIYPESVFRYSSRLTVTMACKMMFRYYPLDTQKCHIQLKSYAYPNKITELAWRQQKGAFLAYPLDVPNFDVELDETRTFTTTTSSGVYSILEFTISLRRNISYHLIQTYLPSVIFLIVSWVAFLIPKENVPERIGMTGMTILSLTVMFGGVGQNMPKVSYLTAMHIWMATCVVLVFVALIEFTVALKLWSLEREDGAVKPSNLNSRHENGSSFSGIIKQDPTTDSDLQQNHTMSGTLSFTDDTKVDKIGSVGRYGKLAKRLERTTSILLPSFFLIFSSFYWPWLIISAKGG